jgi:hypothetical protein
MVLVKNAVLIARSTRMGDSEAMAMFEGAVLGVSERDLYTSQLGRLPRRLGTKEIRAWETNSLRPDLHPRWSDEINVIFCIERA